MRLAVLEKLDQRTAEGVLAAAALATSPDPGIQIKDDPLRRYEHQATELLAEIREQLRIKPGDDSPSSKFEIDNFLASALRRSIAGSGADVEALKRVGQRGLLAPALYKVIQPKGFTDVFYPLAVSANHVDDAVRRPDDYQHLMAEFLIGTSEEKTISLFMKQVISQNPRNSHWLLVQTHRVGTDQVAQAAWRIFPSEVDLSRAATPLDALKAFVDVFGYPIKIDGKQTLFVEAETFPFYTEVKLTWDGAPTDHFWSSSAVSDRAKHLFVVGTAYCIDLFKYRNALANRGLRVREALPAVAGYPKNEIRFLVNEELATITRPRPR